MSVILVSNELSGHYLMHYRTRGSKNGVRLYQNPDGTLTPLGREHYGIGEDNRRYARLESTITKNTSNASKHESKAAEIKRDLDKDEARMLKGKSHMTDWDRTKLLKKYYKLNTKSLAYQRKAERGKYKLMKFLSKVQKSYDDTVAHADSETNFKAFLDSLTEEQRNTLYVIFDDILPDENNGQLEQNGTDGAYLAHFRTKGSENGVRRYQYEDGTYTPLGRIHYGIGLGRKKKGNGDGDSDSSGAEKRQTRAEKKEARRKARAEKREQSKIERKALKDAAELERKNIRNLTDEELQARINRLSKEKQLDQLIREQSERASSPLRQKASKLLSEAAENLAKQALSTLTQKAISKIGERLDEKEVIDLSRYKDVDLFSLKSDELAKIQDAFAKAGQIAENRNKVFSNLENAERREKARKDEEERQRRETEKKAEAERKKAEAEQKAAEEKQRAEEEKRRADQKAEDDRRAAERKAENDRRAEEKRLEDARKHAEKIARQKQAENDRKAKQDAKDAKKSGDAPSTSVVNQAKRMENFGYSPREIAAALGLSEDTVKKILR